MRYHAAIGVLTHHPQQKNSPQKTSPIFSTLVNMQHIQMSNKINSQDGWNCFCEYQVT